jgi:nitrous oxidase accessory protein NosD
MNSKIEFCQIIYNTNGIEFEGEDAKNNLITQNKITLNSQYGIKIPTDEPSNNTIIYNDFIGNGNQFTNQSYDDRYTLPINNWNKTGNNTLTKNGSGEGNYWDDYTGVDLDHDGTGDTWYYLVTRSFGLKYDKYPLMEAYGWCIDWK